MNIIGDGGAKDCICRQVCGLTSEKYVSDQGSRPYDTIDYLITNKSSAFDWSDSSLAYRDISIQHVF